jgi:hypothetical protein
MTTPWPTTKLKISPTNVYVKLQCVEDKLKASGTYLKRKSNNTKDFSHLTLKKWWSKELNELFSWLLVYMLSFNINLIDLF